MTATLESLLNGNKQWAQEVLAGSPDFFTRLAKEQTPSVLWIGCADSRVPPALITQASPGDLFVQRNIANLVEPTDINILSVIEYAVVALQVQHIVVCGHYGCGGVQAAMTASSSVTLNQWLAPLKHLYQKHKAELNAMDSEKSRQNRLVELNIAAQVNNVAALSVVQEAWQQKRHLSIHGWVYALDNGLLKDLKLTVRGG